MSLVQQDEFLDKVITRLYPGEDPNAWKPLPHQIPPDGVPGVDWTLWLLVGGRGCVAPWTRIYDPLTGIHTEIADLASRGRPITVLGLGLNGAVPVQASAPFRKGVAPLWMYEFDDGIEITTTDQHRFLTPFGWTDASAISVGSLVGCASDRLRSISERGPLMSSVNGQHYFGTRADYSRHYSMCSHQYGRRLHEAEDDVQVCVPSQDDALARIQPLLRMGVQDFLRASNHHHLEYDRLSRNSSFPFELLPEDGEYQARSSFDELLLLNTQVDRRVQACSCPSRQVRAEHFRQSWRCEQRIAFSAGWGSSSCLEAQSRLQPIPDQLFVNSHRRAEQSSEEIRRSHTDALLRLYRSCDVAFMDDTRWRRVVAIRSLGMSEFFDMHVPGVNSYLAEGIWNHNTGKSDASANYLNRHVLGPPCDTRVPGGHRISIIAPTQGDAVDSCVTGPSGLKAHNPDIEMRTKAGGTYIYWPNGTEGKLFGAFSPEDVERLRAGGNRCLAAGTMVATSGGPIPIEDVQPGMLVYTRNGLRRVLKAGQTGVRECIEITNGDYSVRCTPDHLIWAGKEWKQASVVSRITTWDGQSFHGMGNAGISVKMGTSAIVDMDSYTAQFTQAPMDPSLPVSKSTTLITTKQITLSRILPLGQRPLTGQSIKTKGALTGIARAVKRLLRKDCMPNDNVTFVDRHTWQVPLAASIAPPVAEIMGLHHERNANGCASCATYGSKPLVGDRPALAVTRVERGTSQVLSAPEPVYDLLVEHDHEFFANGILVANCCIWVEELAAWRQLAKAWPHMKFGLRVGPHPHVIGSSTPKPRKFFVNLTIDKHTVTTHGTTDDNPYLAASVREALYDTYGGTSLGAQELGGKIISGVKGAITTLDALDEVRVFEHPELSQRIVMIDPAMTFTEDSDETGITVQGRAGDHVYLLADLSERLPVDDDENKGTDGWATKAIKAAITWECGMVWYEANQGSDTNKVVLKSALKRYNELNNVHHMVRIEGLSASLSKYDRALALQQGISQGKWHPVGVFEKLEEQLTNWTPEAEADDETSDKKNKKDKSPDRLDAAVHGYRKLMGIGGVGKTSGRQIANARLG